jgi:hypothetical protein
MPIDDQSRSALRKGGIQPEYSHTLEPPPAHRIEP